MTKGIFCDEVLRLLSSGAYSVSDFKFERRDVAVHINGGIAYVVKANFFENYNLGSPGWIDPGFLTTYEGVSVTFNSERNLWYSDLTTLPISLERGLGIQQVSPMQDEASAFIPLGAASAGLYKNLPSEYLFGKVGYRQQGSRIYYKNLAQGHCACETGVLIVMVADTLGLTMESELPLPSDYFLQVQEYVLNVMVKGLTKQDSVIDANSSTK